MITIKKNEAFGELIRTARIKKHLSQKQLANECNISTPDICRIEKGQRKKIPCETLKKIISILDIDINNITNDEIYDELISVIITYLLKNNCNVNLSKNNKTCNISINNKSLTFNIIITKS